MDGRLQFAGGYRAQFFSLDQPVFQPLTGRPSPDGLSPRPPPHRPATLRHPTPSGAPARKFRAHAGRSYRAPSLYERFGVFYGSSYTLYGDPSLRPIAPVPSTAVSTRCCGTRGTSLATYFYTRLNEVIIFDTSSAINPITDPLGRSGGYATRAAASRAEPSSSVRGRDALAAIDWRLHLHRLAPADSISRRRLAHL